MSHRQEILDGMATILWGSAWADHADEHRCSNLSGCEITEVMPPIPDMVRKNAIELAAAIEKESHASLDELYARSEKACAEYPGRTESRPCPYAGPGKHTPERFGECLAWEAMGAGVSWDDDHATVSGLKFPFFEPCEIRDYADSTCDVQTDTPRCTECFGWYDHPWRDEGKNKCPHCGEIIRAKRARKGA